VPSSLTSSRRQPVRFETAISLLKKRVEPASLSLAYTGYGTCKQGLCEFDAALAAYSEALRLSRKIGDDLRSAIITFQNMCVASLHRGDFVSAVTSGELSLAMACRALSPRLVNIHLNLAIASAHAG